MSGKFFNGVPWFQKTSMFWGWESSQAIDVYDCSPSTKLFGTMQAYYGAHESWTKSGQIYNWELKPVCSYKVEPLEETVVFLTKLSEQNFLILTKITRRVSPVYPGKQTGFNPIAFRSPESVWILQYMMWAINCLKKTIKMTRSCHFKPL